MRGVCTLMTLTALALGQAAEAQSGGQIDVTPLPGLGEPGQTEGDLSGFAVEIDPEMGLQSTGPGNSDNGFIVPREVDENGVLIQIDPGGQEGVALIQAPNPRREEEVMALAAASAPVAVLRGLDKTLAVPTDFEMAVGETVVFGRVAIRMLDCRYPVDNPSSDAFAHLQIADLSGRTLFDGWMIASSPALMALEHPRYDVWVLRCRTS